MTVDRSLSDVLQDLLRNLQEIVRSEVRLAKTELRDRGKAGGLVGTLVGRRHRRRTERMGIPLVDRRLRPCHRDVDVGRDALVAAVLGVRATGLILVGRHTD